MSNPHTLQKIPEHYEWQLPLDHTDSTQYRQGLSWTTEELAVVIEAARTPLPASTIQQKKKLHRLAQQLRRSPSAVESRVRKMLPEKTPQPWKSLHQRLQTNPDYDWKQQLSSNDEPLIDYQRLAAIAELDPESNASVTAVAELTNVSAKRAESLLARVHQGSFVAAGHEAGVS